MASQVPAGKIEQAAQRLVRAQDTGVPCAPVRDLIDAGDLAAAYAVQSSVLSRRIAEGRHPVGRKIGLTSSAVQAQLGVDQPDFGVLLDDMWQREGQPVHLDRLLQPKVEAEIAFVLAEDVVDPDVDHVMIRRYVDHAVASLEIVDSRISGWDITIADTVADNASSGAFVIGRHALTLDEFEPAAVEMRMLVNGQEVSSGNGAACLGDPLRALAWLARTAIQVGSPLRIGDIILSGALGPMAPISPGDEVVAEFTELGALSASFVTTGVRR